MPLLPWLVGTWVLGLLLPVPLSPFVLGFGVAGLLLGTLRGHVRRPWRLACLGLASCVLSAAWAHWRTPHELPDDIARLAPRRWAVIAGRIASDPLPSPRGWRFEVEVRSLVAPWREPVAGRVMARYQGPERPRYGSLVHLEGSLNRPSPAMNPGEFSYRDYLARDGIYATLSARRLQVVEAASWSLLGTAIALKDRCMAVLSHHLPADRASLLGSLLLGSGASPIDEETAESFRTLGLGHLLAVSGAQILIIVEALQGLCLALGLRRRLAIPLCVGAIAFYGLMTGLPPSVLRAIVMASLSLLFWGARRHGRSLVPLLLAAWGMLVYHPPWLLDLGFQFSVLATFALQHTTPILAERFTGMPETWARTIASTLAAALWVTPLQLMTFGQLSAWTLVANLGAMLAIEVLTIAGAGLLVLALVLGPIGLGVGVTPFFWPLDWLLCAMTGSVDLLNRLPGASHHLAPLEGWQCVAMYGCLGLMLWWVRRAALWRAAGILAIAALLPFVRAPRPDLEVHVLSVGQGDGIVLKTPGGRWYLIDCGPAWDGGDAGERVILPFLRRQGVRRLHGLVVTHAHADHLGGATSLLKGMPVDGVWEGGQAEDGALYGAFLCSLLERRIPFESVKAGTSTRLEADVWLEVLGPPVHPWHGTHSDCNNNSVVVKLRYGRTSILLAGDLEQEAERRLALEAGDRLRADVLKVSHHGSRFGSVPEFLQAVRPGVSVISVGERNLFRHPSAATLTRLRAFGPIYRTDRDGAVSFSSDGDEWHVRTVRNAAS